MRSQDNHASAETKRWFRVTLAVAGAFWFIWLGVEDPGVITVLLLAMILILPAAIYVFYRRISRMRAPGSRRFLAIIAMGFFGGLLIAPLAILLMAVKTSLHSHIYPDFTRADVILVLESAPAWTLAALLLAAAGALYDRAQA